MSKTENKTNINLIAQAVHVYQDRSHPGLAKAKTRGEISRTTKKVYKQKHTGNARHGSKRAPIFVGGGVTHGPKGMKRLLVLPQGMRKGALEAALTLKKEEKLYTVADFTGVVKTKEALTRLPDAKRVTVALVDTNKGAFRALRNVSHVTVFYKKDLNARQVFYGGHLVVEEAGAKTEPTKEKKTVKALKKTTKTK